MSNGGEDRFFWAGESMRRVPWDWARRLEFEQIYVDPGSGHFLDEVLLGLSKEPKSLPYYYLYDERGSALFQQITRLTEYYPSACECEILRDCACDILEEAGCPRQLVEFGSGSSEKTRLLIAAALSHRPEICYVPIDISGEALKDAALGLIRDFEGLSVHALAAEYRQGLRALSEDSPPRLFIFLGSSIGNMPDREAVSFLRAIREVCRRGDYLLIGADLAKSASIIEPAYNDEKGVTAAFNLNILERINRELGADFDISMFEHQAPYYSRRGYVEMRLVSLVDQEVEIEQADRSFAFDQGDYIWTERSRKYTEVRLGGILRRAGFETCERYHDRKNWYSLRLLEPC